MEYTMLRWMSQSLILLVVLLSLTGCWNRRELNELSIASAFGIDKLDGKYVVSVQLINGDEVTTNKGSGGQRMPIVTQQLAGGKTIFESVRQLTTTTPRKIYSSHIQMLVIGEDLAKEGIAKILDALSRDHELRTDFYIVVARNTTAANVLKILSPLEKIPSHKMFSSLESAQKTWGGASKVDLHQLIYDLVSNGKDPALTMVEINGDPQIGQSHQNLDSVHPPVLLEYDGLGLFNKDRLVGWLNQEESKGYNYVVGNIQSTVVNVTCPEGGRIGIELIRTNKKLQGKVVNGKPAVDVHINAEGNVGESECTLDISRKESIELLQEKTSQAIKETILAAIKKAKRYKSDIFGFGDAIHRANPKLWKKLEDHWEDEFIDLPVQVTVGMKIRRTGSVIESFLDEMR